MYERPPATSNLASIHWTIRQFMNACLMPLEVIGLFEAALFACPFVDAILIQYCDCKHMPGPSNHYLWYVDLWYCTLVS